MAWLGERNGLRRHRASPSPSMGEDRGASDGSPHRGLNRTWILATALFVVVAVAIADQGYIPPAFRVGVQLDQDIRARVSFLFLDRRETNLRRDQAIKRTPRVYDEVEGWVEDISHEAERLMVVCGSSNTMDAAKRQLANEGLRLDLDAIFDEVHALGLEQTRKQIVEPLKADLRARVFDEIAILDSDDYEEEVTAEQAGRRQQIIRRRPDGSTAEVDTTPQVYNVPVGARNLVDWRIDVVLQNRSEALRKAVKELVGIRLRSNLVLSPELTRARQEQAVEKLQPVIVEIRRGAVIARRGDVLGESQYSKAELENRAFLASLPLHARLMRLSGTALLFLVVVGIFLVGARRLSPHGSLSGRRMAALGAAVAVTLAIARTFAVLKIPSMLAPAALTAIITGLMLPPITAVAGCLGLVVMMSVVASESFAVAVALGCGAVASALSAAGAKRPADILRAGMLAGAAQFLAIVGLDLASGGDDLKVVLSRGGWGLLNGAGCGLLAMASLSAMESFFGFTTKVSLLELTNQDQPLLRQLILRAAGTYHHSFVVGNLAEAGAEAIGADALLARTASYYHDIGKLTKPEYFSENQPPGRSRHDKLTPAMSTLIITSHVKDGMDFAREHRLPRVIREVIMQHHGTSRVEYFYRQAKEASAGAPVDEESFRYPGPKPQTREAAIVLVADTVEAASRSLDSPSPARIRSLVHDLMMVKLMDGQLDESNITLRDLRTVEEVFVRVLTTMFHRRVAYPAREEEAKSKGPSERAPEAEAPRQ